MRRLRLALSADIHMDMPICVCRPTRPLLLDHMLDCLEHCYRARSKQHDEQYCHDRKHDPEHDAPENHRAYGKQQYEYLDGLESLRRSLRYKHECSSLVISAETRTGWESRS